MRIAQSRRQFLTGLSWACTSGLSGASSALAAEGPLETTTVRIANRHSLCNAPQHVAEELLRAEGFTEIRYIDTAAPVTAEAIARGKVDFSMAHASDWPCTRCRRIRRSAGRGSRRLLRAVCAGRHP